MFPLRSESDVASRRAAATRRCRRDAEPVRPNQSLVSPPFLSLSVPICLVSRRCQALWKLCPSHNLEIAPLDAPRPHPRCCTAPLAAPSHPDPHAHAAVAGLPPIMSTASPSNKDTPSRSLLAKILGIVGESNEQNRKAVLLLLRGGSVGTT